MSAHDYLGILLIGAYILAFPMAWAVCGGWWVWYCRRCKRLERTPDDINLIGACLLTGLCWLFLGLVIWGVWLIATPRVG